MSWVCTCTDPIVLEHAATADGGARRWSGARRPQIKALKRLFRNPAALGLRPLAPRFCLWHWIPAGTAAQLAEAEARFDGAEGEWL